MYQSHMETFSFNYISNNFWQIIHLVPILTEGIFDSIRIPHH